MKNKITLSVLSVLFITLFTQAQTIDLIGVGVHDTPIATLTFTDLGTIDHVTVEAVYKWHVAPPTGAVNFYDNDESVYVDAAPVEYVRTDLGTNDYGQSPSYFTATFNTIGDEGITLDQLANFGGIHSFIAYVYRNNNSTEVISYADYNHVFMFRNGEWNAFDYVIPINTSVDPRDVTIKVAISEIAYDDRICVIDVTDGNQTIQQILQQPSLGNALNITPFTLENVAPGVSEITITIYSPPYTLVSRGDSFISGGVVLDVEQDYTPEYYCTLTQGFYGNYGGNFNGLSTYELMYGLLASDLVLGGNGNTLTLTQNDVDCLIGRLPGGGPAKKLNGAATCSNPVGIKLHKKNGRFQNILVAQAITLGLNLRLDNYLGGVLISDLPFNFSGGVMNNLPANATIDDLFSLVNDVLAGENYPGCNAGTMAGSLGMINDYFDECQPLENMSNSLYASPKSAEITETATKEFSIYPNPSSNYTTIELLAQSSGSLSIDVYNIMGMRVATIPDENVEAGERIINKINVSDFEAGVYFVTARLNNQILREKLTVN